MPLINDNALSYPKYNYNGIDANETGCFKIGIEYSQKLRKNLFINSGIEFANHKIEVTYFSDDPFFQPPPHNKGELSFFSCPLTLRLSFLKYLFLQGGLVVDIQAKNNVFDQLSGKYDVIRNQSGIGSLFELGGSYRFKNNFSIFSGLNNEIHSLIPFERSSDKKKWVDVGIKIGLRYHFK